MVNTTDGRLAQRYVAAAAAAKSLQSCLILSDPMDCSLPGSPVPGVLQARTLEWVAISFSNVWKWKVKVKSLSCVRLLATTWTAAYQAPSSMGFSRQEYWSGVPLPTPILYKLFKCIPNSRQTLQNKYIPEKHHVGPKQSVLFFCCFCLFERMLSVHLYRGFK